MLGATRKFALATLLMVALGNVPGFAQGCALCRANAKATPKDGQRAINRAVFVMLLRPEGLIPSRRRAAEFREGVHDQPLYDVSGPVA
mgnify:CR=1 FL=1